MRNFLHIRRDIFISVVLIIATIVIYWQVGNHEFISLDDGRYVFENPKVRMGMSMESITWAFGFTGIAYWHPLTWLSHMLDCQLFGLNSGRHHLMNLMFHLTNSLLLFYLFRTITGDSWKSGVIAILFAVHPINVESVAWVAERKNVLSTFFWMLTLLSYSLYVTKAQISRYVLALLFFALGLLAKPAIVTLPFVLLLLDFWPLNRFRIEALVNQNRNLTWSAIKTWLQKSNIVRLILEKIPFLVLSCVSVYISFLSTQYHDIVVSTYEAPVHLRLANGLVSYMAYLGKMFWPLKLAVFYPYPNEISIWLTMMAGIWLICVSMIVMRWSLRMPYLAVGWFWYLGTLVPHIGLMQAGLWPALADRWAYIPFVGLFIILAWGIPRLIAARQNIKFALPVVTVLAIFICSAITWIQIGYWKNNIPLYRHAIAVTRGNDVAHNNLGAAYYDAGKVDQAIYHFVEALKIKPGYSAAHSNLNKALGARGKMNGLIEKMKKLLKIYPELSALHYNLGNLYRDSGQFDKAIIQYREALDHQPNFIQAINNLAAIYVIQEDYPRALVLLKHILEIETDASDVSFTIACIYAKQNKVAEAIDWLKKAVRMGFDEWDFLKSDPRLENIRDSLYYKSLTQIQ